MKFRRIQSCQQVGQVAPFTGAWIEIIGERNAGAARMVAPFRGVWIEIAKAGGAGL